MKSGADGTVSRRALGRLAAGGLVGAVVGTAGCNDERVAVTDLAGLKLGEALPFRYPPQHPAFLVKLGTPAETGIGPDADIVAFHTACPHMGCPLGVTDIEALQEGVLGPCGCHQSTFDLRFKGRQIHGRATQNLVRVKLEIEDGTIFAVGVEGVPFGEAMKLG